MVDIEEKDGIKILVFNRNIVFFVDSKTGKTKDDKLYNKLALLDNIDLNKVKHSKEIIDLVEEGDYVNGKRVIKANCRFTYIDDDSSYGESEIENGLDLGDELLYWSSEIKSIITKEQIKQIEFRIGD